MAGRLEALQQTLEAACNSRLLFYNYIAPVSPLECALPRFPATVHSKQLTGSDKSFRMRTYTKPGGGVPTRFRLPIPRLLQREQAAAPFASYSRIRENPRPPFFRTFFQSDYPTRIVVLSERSESKDLSTQFSITCAVFDFPYALSLLFATLTKTAGCTLFLPETESATRHFHQAPCKREALHL